LFAHEVGQELQRRETVPLGARQMLVEAIFVERHVQVREVGQHSLPQVFSRVAAGLAFARLIFARSFRCLIFEG
jgi:hypothetical protein